MSDTLKLRTPCCGRAVTPCDRRLYTALVVERTCPKCRTAYQVVVIPLAGKDGEHHRWVECHRAYFHEVTWNPKS